jgi:hypothetical protein
MMRVIIKQGIRTKLPLYAEKSATWGYKRLTAYHDQEINSVNYLTFQKRMFRFINETVNLETTLERLYGALYRNFKPNVTV